MSTTNSCALCLVNPAEVSSNMDNIGDICIECDDHIQEYIMDDNFSDYEYGGDDEETEDFSDF